MRDMEVQIHTKVQYQAQLQMLRIRAGKESFYSIAVPLDIIFRTYSVLLDYKLLLQ